MMNQIETRNAALRPLAEVLNANSSDSVALDLMNLPTPLMDLHAQRYLLLRGFLQDTADEQAQIDVLYQFAGQNGGKAVHAARLTVVAGAQTHTGHPLEGHGTEIWYEADHAKRVSGLVRPQVRAIADGQCLIYLPTLEATRAAFRCHNIDTAARVLLLAKPIAEVPPATEIPFHAMLDTTGAWSNATVNKAGPGESGALPASGSGQQYVIDKLEITAAADLDPLSIKDSAGTPATRWAHNIPMGFCTDYGFKRPLAIGENKTIKLAKTDTTAGTRVDLYGRKVPVAD